MLKKRSFEALIIELMDLENHHEDFGLVDNTHIDDMGSTCTK